MANCKKNKLITLIFDAIVTKGIESSKGDIMSNDPIEDKVYTKRINIGKDYGEGTNAVEVTCVSLTSGDSDWAAIGKNTSKMRNIRINIRNNQNKWCNIFVNEAPIELLEFVSRNI